MSLGFGSGRMAGWICIACRRSSGGVTRRAAAKGGFLKRSVTIIDIAGRAGVSFKTVSRVLNGAPTVAEVLRGKVEAAMRELDYKPNRAARLLRGGKAQALGFIVGVQAEARDSPDMDRRMPSYGADVILGLLQACSAAEHHLVIDRKSVVSGKSVSVRVDLGGRRIIKTNINTLTHSLSSRIILLSANIESTDLHLTDR